MDRFNFLSMTETATLTVREIWESVRPLAEAAAIVSHAGLDVMELEDLEAKWQTETIPFLQSFKIEGAVRKELDRLIKFSEDRIKKAQAEYERPDKPFAERKALMEERIPTAEKFLKMYQSWWQETPLIKWEPMDVVDIKRDGTETFVRKNLDRFYS